MYLLSAQTLGMPAQITAMVRELLCASLTDARVMTFMSWCIGRRTVGRFGRCPRAGFFQGTIVNCVLLLRCCCRINHKIQITLLQSNSSSLLFSTTLVIKAKIQNAKYISEILLYRSVLTFSCRTTTRQNINVGIKINLEQTTAAKLNRKISVNTVRITLSLKPHGLLTATVSQSS